MARFRRADRLAPYLERATRARDEAAEAFLALDDGQEVFAATLKAYGQADTGAAGARVLAEGRPLLSAADRASTDYIAALDQHGGYMEAETPELISAAAEAFAGSTAMLRGAAQALDQFLARHAEIPQRLTAVAQQINAPRQRAAEALDRARRAVQQMVAAGVHSASLSARLVAAEGQAQQLDQGPFQDGPAATVERAEALTKEAQQVAELSRELVTLRDNSSHQLESVRIRLDAVRGRISRADDALSQLRRSYSLACSVDLDRLPALATQAVTDADQKVSRAADAATASEWEVCADALRAARERLTAAEGALTSIDQRREELDSVAADPAARKERARFVVHDAQSLVVSAGSAAPAGEARILDSLAQRVDSADARLQGVHPDYWGYLQELGSIQELVHGVVRRTRAAMATHR